MTIKIGVSGKRHIPDNEKNFVSKQIESSIRQILSKHNTTQFTGYTGLAIGADTIFAEVVTQVFKQPLQIVLPFDVSEFEKDFAESPVDLDKFKRILSANQNIVTIPGNKPTDNTQRAKAYFEVGKYIVNTCDEVIFVWDELKPSGIGGTAEVMGYYCEKKEKTDIPYISIHPENEDLLNSQLTGEYEFSNNLAIKNRNKYKRIGKAVIFLGWVAVILFATNTAYFNTDEPDKKTIKLITVLLEFILVVFVFILIAIAKKKDFHGKYLKARIRAETFRILKYFYHANVDVKISTLTTQEDVALSQVAQNINAVVQNDSYKSKWYSNYVIKSLINEQKKYHSQKIKNIGNKAHYLERINFAMGIIFLVNLFINCVSTILNVEFGTYSFLYSHEFALFISMALPASYAAIEGIIYFQEWKILKKYSHVAEKSLEKSLSELPAPVEKTSDEDCFTKQSVTLNIVGGIMLTDNKNWQLILEDKNNYQFII